MSADIPTVMIPQPNVPLSAAERRTLERLRLSRERLRCAGRLLVAGYVPPAESDPRVVWSRAGWEPSRWRWDHDVAAWRPMPASEPGGVGCPSQTLVETVPLDDHVRDGGRVDRREGVATLNWGNGGGNGGE